MSSSSLIQKISRLAVQTFCRESSKVPNITPNASNLEQIKSLINRITTKDLCINPILLRDTGPFNPQTHSAPVTYMQIYEDSDVTICVFILKGGVRLPLHDHPGMYGLLKVIHGKILIQSYTLKENLNMENDPSSRENRTFNNRPIYSAIKHTGQYVSSQDPVCVLTPSSENLHEISSVDGLSAFIDILSPPYGSDTRLGIERDCHYFKEVDKKYVQDGPMLLIHIPTPADFWCDRAEYEGPSVNNQKKG